MNILIKNSSSSPVIGLWSNTDNRWVVRTSAQFVAGTTNQIYPLITAIPLEFGKVYSFRTANTATYEILSYDSGSTGSGPVTFVSVKRLK